MYRLKTLFATKLEMTVKSLPASKPDQGLGYDIKKRYNYKVDESARRVSAALEVVVSGIADTTEILEATICLQAQFDFDENEALAPDKFAREYGLAWFFPFLRETIVNLSFRSPFPALVIPAANIVRMTKELDEILDPELTLLGAKTGGSTEIPATTPGR